MDKISFLTRNQLIFAEKKKSMLPNHTIKYAIKMNDMALVIIINIFFINISIN